MGGPYEENGRRENSKESIGRAFWWRKTHGTMEGYDQEVCKDVRNWITIVSHRDE